MTVLFLPGAGGDPEFWAPVAAALALPGVRLAWPGLGHQPHRDDVRGLDDLVRLTLAHMDAPVDLVAQSMGGVVAVLAALTRPDRVRRLVLVATSGGVDVTRFGSGDWRPDYRRQFPNAATWIGEVRIDLTDRLRTIAAPALLVWGEADPISPVAMGEHLATLLPRAHLVVIPGGTHAMARDRPAEVAPHIARHLTGSDPNNPTFRG